MLLVLALPLVAVLATAIYSEYRTSVRRAESAAVELAVATANGVSQVISDGHAVLERLALDPAILALNEPRCAPWLREVNDVSPQFANIVVADTLGTVVCSAVPSEAGAAISERPWFQVVRLTRGPATGRFQIGSITGRPVVAVAHPMFDATGTLVGIVAAGIDLSRFQRLLRDLPLPPDAVVTLADDEWTVLARSVEPERWVGQTLPGDTVPEQQVAPGIGIIRAGGLEGIDRVFGFARVDATNWRVYAGVPETWVYAPVREALVRRGASVVFVLALVSALSVLLFRRVSHSLAALVDGTRATAEGEGARVPEAGPTEVVAIARQFNATLAARDRAEEDLRRARERYASILRNAVSGIFVATPEGRFVEVNAALVRMLGYPSETALRSVNARIVFADPGLFDGMVERALASERIQGEEAEWRRFDGEYVVARLSASLAITSEGDRVIEVIAEDVTERRALEQHLQQTQKMEAIGRLAGGVAHDFNNLLTIVRGQAQFLLLGAGREEDVKEHATEIVEATKRGARLTRQLLAFGRRQLVQPMPLEINDVITNLEPMLRRVTGEEIRFAIRLPEGMPPAHADPGQVEQVVMNLVFNARDAMSNGGDLVLETRAVSLSPEDCRGRVSARPGDWVAISVSDTGEGISPDMMGRVFEPFFTTKPQGQGTGLGLATVYGIVTQAGGWIEVESVPGEGSRFSVFLPRAIAMPEPEALPMAAPAVGELLGTILVVEDEAPVRKVVVGALARRGHTVLEAEGGTEALAVAAAHANTIDLLVTDEMMPGMRGSQLAEKLLPRRPGMRVLFMSGYADRIPTGSSFQGVPSLFLAKPFSQEELLAAVATLLHAKPKAGAGGLAHAG